MSTRRYLSQFLTENVVLFVSYGQSLYASTLKTAIFLELEK